MHPHSYPSPPRIIAPGGPVSAAIRTMREANELPPLLAEQFDGERLEIQALRLTIQRQLQADFDRIDRCLVILDTPGGADDLEDGGDDEPSLCGAGTHHGGSLGASTYDGDDREDDAGDNPEHVNEDGGDINDEPHDAEEDANEEDLGGEHSLGWCENVGQLNLGANTADGDATALERHGAGFYRSGHDDDESSHDHEAVDEDGSDAVEDAPRRAAGGPLSPVPEYILNVRGNCCAPVYPEGSQVLFETKARPAPGDFVAIHFTPEAAKRIGFDAWLKRLVFMNEPGRGNIEPCICVEQLNPARSYVIPWSNIVAVHRAVGPKPDHVRGVPMTDAARRRQQRTWAKGPRAKALKRCA